jgi:hypothetical protein
MALINKKNKEKVYKFYDRKQLHKTYGDIYNEFDKIKSGKYEPVLGDDRGGRAVRPSPRRIQLPLFPVPA